MRCVAGFSGDTDIPIPPLGSFSMLEEGGSPRGAKLLLAASTEKGLEKTFCVGGGAKLKWDVLNVGGGAAAAIPAPMHMGFKRLTADVVWN